MFYESIVFCSLWQTGRILCLFWGIFTADWSNSAY